jgi:predicted tellurium resistance membrane protein TerC
MLDSFMLLAAEVALPENVPLFSVQALLALVTLTVLEIVLGIDNIVFISIVTNKLPEKQRKLARNIGLGAAMAMRIALLFSIFWIMKLTTPLFSIPQFWEGKTEAQMAISGRDLVMLLGGLFLLVQATRHIHEHISHEHASAGNVVAKSFGMTIAQIMLLDIVFSLDSVITAVGMAQHIEVMVIAVVISVGVMMAFSGAIAGFIEKHPSFQMLALSFLMLIGAMLIAEGFHVHVPKGYIYFPIAFSILVEVLNMAAKRKKG